MSHSNRLKPRSIGLSKDNGPGKHLLSTFNHHPKSRATGSHTRIGKDALEGQVAQTNLSRQNSLTRRDDAAVSAPPMTSSDEEVDQPEDSLVDLRSKKRKRPSTSPAVRKVEDGEEDLKRPQRNTQAKKQKGTTLRSGKGSDSDSEDTCKGADMLRTKFGPSKGKKQERAQQRPRPVRRSVGQKGASELDEKSLSTNPRRKSRVGGSPDFVTQPETRRKPPSATFSTKARLQKQENGIRKTRSLEQTEASPRKKFIKPSGPLPSAEEASPVTKPRRGTQQKHLPTSPPSPSKVFFMPRRLSGAGSEQSPSRSPTGLLISGRGVDDGPWPTSGIPFSSARSMSPLSDLESVLGDDSICPMCHEPVDQELLDDFKRKHPRMRIAQQRRFCDLHIEISARKTWSERGYPDIDWRDLESRISEHYDFLRQILQGGESYYTDVFNSTIRSGKDKSTAKSEKSLTPGYYGPRGLRVMTDMIMEEFTQLLLERPLEDRLIAARGRVAYVQSVLVPEVAVKLITEDMGVEEVEARTILTDSASVGDILNEEAEDVDRFKARSDSEAESIV